MQSILWIDSLSYTTSPCPGLNRFLFSHLLSFWEAIHHFFFIVALSVILSNAQTYQVPYPTSPPREKSGCSQYWCHWRESLNITQAKSLALCLGSGSDMIHLVPTPAFARWQHTLCAEKMCRPQATQLQGVLLATQRWEQCPGGREHPAHKEGGFPSSLLNTTPGHLALYWAPTPNRVVRPLSVLASCHSVWSYGFTHVLASDIPKRGMTSLQNRYIIIFLEMLCHKWML